MSQPLHTSLKQPQDLAKIRLICDTKTSLFGSPIGPHTYIYNSRSHQALTKLKKCTCNTHIGPNHHQTSLNMICDIKTSFSPHWTLCKIPMLLTWTSYWLFFWWEPSTPKFMDNSEMKQKFLPKLLNIYRETINNSSMNLGVFSLNNSHFA